MAAGVYRLNRSAEPGDAFVAENELDPGEVYRGVLNKAQRSDVGGDAGHRSRVGAGERGQHRTWSSSWVTNGPTDTYPDGSVVFAGSIGQLTSSRVYVGSVCGATQRDSARHSATRRDSARLGATQRDSARLGATRRDTARLGATQRDSARHSATRRDTARHSATRRDTARL